MALELDRLGDWVVFTVRWDQLASAWRSAEPSRRLVLEDGRPGVLSTDGTRVQTVPRLIWGMIRAHLDERPWHDATPLSKRERKCEACGNTLTLTKEYSHAWCFFCPVCKTAEVHGKTRVGGTIGAGEREPDERSR